MKTVEIISDCYGYKAGDIVDVTFPMAQLLLVKGKAKYVVKKKKKTE